MYLYPHQHHHSHHLRLLERPFVVAQALRLQHRCRQHHPPLLFVAESDMRTLPHGCGPLPRTLPP
jgi:hypothetical protein